MRLLLAITRIPALLWFLIAGIWGYAIYRNFDTTVKVEYETEISAKKSQMKRLDADIKRAEDFQKLKEEKFAALQALEIQLNQASGKIPRTMDVPSLLKPLADISDKVGLQFIRFKPGTKFNQEFLFVYPLDVELRGTYSQVMSFLDETSQLTRVISTKKLTLDQPQPKGTASLISAKVTFYAYSMDPNSNLGKNGQ